jgi:hypothetical protein
LLRLDPYARLEPDANPSSRAGAGFGHADRGGSPDAGADASCAAGDGGGYTGIHPHTC